MEADYVTGLGQDCFSLERNSLLVLQHSRTKLNVITFSWTLCAYDVLSLYSLKITRSVKHMI